MSQMWGAENALKGYFKLDPDQILTAVETAEWAATGYLFSLNSYENRVYEIELENRESGVKKRVVAKFYRPGRWTQAQILDEHAFLAHLKEIEVPVVAPIAHFDDKTLKYLPALAIYVAVFPKMGGRSPEDLTETDYVRLGRLLGRIHAVGEKRMATTSRIRMSVDSHGREPLAYLLRNNIISDAYIAPYTRVAEEIFKKLEFRWRDLENSGGMSLIHGDCHLGNLLWGKEGPFFLDFDDCLVGPRIQDFWLLGAKTEGEFVDFLAEGYRDFCKFDPLWKKWIEPLRALRFVHYTGWVARRFEDPAFKQAFPFFGTDTYWKKEIDDLERQLDWIRNDVYFSGTP